MNFEIENLDCMRNQVLEMAQIDMPCVIYGDTGKTFFLSQLFSNIIVIDTREVLETKSLSGFYLIDNGEIIFINGRVINAMKEGSCLIFKNIDYNSKVLEFIKPILTSKELVTASGDKVLAHENFRIFFTSKDMFDLEDVVFIGPIKNCLNNTLNIFGGVREEIHKILLFLFKNKEITCKYSLGEKCEGICFKKHIDCNCFTGNYICDQHFRMICDLKQLFGENTNAIMKTNEGRVKLYQSIVNAFLVHESREIEEYLFLNTSPISFPNMNFAKTEAALHVINGLICNIKSKKPSLLIGETGAGKTAIIQYLCKHSQEFFGTINSLKVINMSSDFDASDLIGGYHAIDFDKKIRDFYNLIKKDVPKGLDKKTILKNLLTLLPSNYHEEIYKYLVLYDKKIPFIFKNGIIGDAMSRGYWVLLDEVNLASQETLNLLEAILSKNYYFTIENGTENKKTVHENFRIFACMNPFGDFGKKKYESTVFNTIIMKDFSINYKCIRSVVQSISKNMIADIDSISLFYYDFKKAISRKQFTNIIEPLVSGRTLYRALQLIVSKITIGENLKRSIFNAINLLFFTQLDLNSRASAILLYKKYFDDIPIIRNDEGFNDNINGFIVTPKVKIHLNDIRLAVESNFPVLLQGDTSTGKTSLILALANLYRVKVLRINNHEHTEASDYLGNYITSNEGIVFKEGALLTAMRQGHWIILDELNLAPSDVLEVLNRLLDDNKEIFLSEIDTVIKPHPNFRIFGTQNISYGGRQGLSKSLRNRFVEIFFYEKDETEIKAILESSCKLPKNFINLMMSVFNLLKSERTINSLMTLRDLFKWARRQPTGYYNLYEIGLNLMYERQRTNSDRKIILDIFNKVFKERMDFEKRDFHEKYFDWSKECDFTTFDPKSFSIGYAKSLDESFNSITSDLVLTKSYLRLIDLIYKALKNGESVLLVGETGIGKTKICEVISKLFKKNLRIISMHNNIESSDFIGNSILIDGKIKWNEGIVVTAMKSGDFLLLDEINLAEDSVLERLNSLLEDKHTLFIPELGLEYSASESFRIIATMNPSGDFGKRELSPALKNRFTEIFFELETKEYLRIFERMLSNNQIPALEIQNYIRELENLVYNFSIRKIELICNHIKKIKLINHQEKLINYQSNSNFAVSSSIINKCGIDIIGNELCILDPIEDFNDIWSDLLELLGLVSQSTATFVSNHTYFGVSPYYLFNKASSPFCFDTPTTCVNLRKIIRGLSLGRGLLLEGDPGIGKTTIIQSIAKISKIPVLRINLSEQTEMSDIVGSFLPVDNSIKFIESEFVDFIRKGYWVILDEVNLCTQSVIEGLNSVLDYRRELFVNNQVIKAHPRACIFATMNPQTQNNGRKILPKSFIDRFISIKMDQYSSEDVKFIIKKLYGQEGLYLSNLSLRGNLKFNEISLGFETPESKMVLKLPPDSKEISEIFILEATNGSILYHIDDKTFSIGSVSFQYYFLDHGYTLVHSQIRYLERICRCFIKKIPIILTGKADKILLLQFLSKLLNLSFERVDCHSETDICDLLGQYQKSEIGSKFFEWKDSNLVRSLKNPSLIVLNCPELVDKSVFDRLNSLFEAERFLNISEKGFDTMVSIDVRCVFVLMSESPHLLSPALLDRCEVIDIPLEYSYIDLYKIFSSASKIYHLEMPEVIYKDKEESKEYSLVESYSFLRGFLSLNGVNYSNPSVNLKLDLKKFKIFKKLPEYLTSNLKLQNFLKEKDIDFLFAIEEYKPLSYDKKLLECYRHVSSFRVKMPKNYSERIINFTKSPNIISIIKNTEMKIDGTNELCYKPPSCFNFPGNMLEYKQHFISCLKYKSLAWFHELFEFSNFLLSIDTLENISFSNQIFEMICGSEDPLKTVRVDIVNEFNSKKHAIMLKISFVVKAIYKYGEKCIFKWSNNNKICQNSLIEILNILFDNFDTTESNYNALILDIDKKLSRDYSKFKSILTDLTFCTYSKDDNLRVFLEDFNDIFDYYLVHLFNNRFSCKSCQIKKHPTTKELYLILLREGYYSKFLKFNYSKYIYEYYAGVSNSLNGLVFEAICFEEPLEIDIFCKMKSLNPNYTNKDCSNLLGVLSFSNIEINECLSKIFPLSTSVKAIETREGIITLSPLDIQLTDFVSKFSIFSTPEYLINKLQEFKVEHELEFLDEPEKESKQDAVKSSNIFLLEKLVSKYKTGSCLEIQKNYRYFMYFLFNEPSIFGLEKLFMSSNVCEYLDIIFFSQAFLKYKYTDLLYNIILRFKAFDIEKIQTKKLKECKVKLFKEPSQYYSILSEFVDKFMLVPITSILNIRFEIPVCQENHHNAGPLYLLNGFSCSSKSLLLSETKHSFIQTDSKSSICECKQWIYFSKIFDRTKLSNTLTKPLKKDFVLNLFYNRSPEEKFSYSEISLAKVFVKAYDGFNKGIYDDKSTTTLLNLLELSITNPFPPFLYFIYIFCDVTNEGDTEDGEAIKAGEGENYSKDKNLKEEDIADEYDFNQANNSEQDAIDMNNDGDLFSASDDLNGSDGVQPDCDNESGEKQENDSIDRGGIENSKDGDLDDSILSEFKEDDFSEYIENTDIEDLSSSEEEPLEITDSEISEHDYTKDENKESFDKEDHSDFNSLLNYAFSESKLNKNQTCEKSDGYNRKIEGGNFDDQSALKEGNGNEIVEGEGAYGKGVLYDKQVLFHKISYDCTNLVNQLRVILESNKVSKYKGDYKSGKKLNLKKLIPYIASDFRKDKIWMKRQRSDKKEYKLRIFIDNSKSMQDQHLVNILSITYNKISNAFSLLGIPVELYKFASNAEKCSIDELTFTDDATVLNWVDDFTDGINIILTDGIFQNVGYYKDNFLAVMIDRGNIKKMSKVSVIDNKIFIEKYLDSFSLNYCIIESIDDFEKIFIEGLTSLIKKLN